MIERRPPVLPHKWPALHYTRVPVRIADCASLAYGWTISATSEKIAALMILKNPILALLEASTSDMSSSHYIAINSPTWGFLTTYGT
jgi:hypothetical protein